MKRIQTKIFLALLMVILGFVGCDPGNGTKTYTITIGTLINANGSTITANPTSGTEGTEITLTVIPNGGYRLKAGTLKFGTTLINETTKIFTLPASDVVVTAEFENTSNDVDLIGTTWKCDTVESLTFTFNNGNTWTGTHPSVPEGIGGDYEVSEKNVTINITINPPTNGDPTTWHCTVEDNILTMDSLTFSKQE
jgi:hypothetical protein